MSRAVRKPRPSPARASSRPLCAGAIAIAAAIAGCGGGDDGSAYFGSTVRRGKEPATFYVNNGSEPEYLDPGRAADSGSGALIAQLYEGLTTYDPRDSHPIQGVAERWDQSEDNRLFRFHLRADARWSDGKPVTARDFVYAWRRVLRPATASRGAQNLYSLLNGELFNLGRIRVLDRDAPLLAAPRDGAEVKAQLAKGAAARILGRSPMLVKTAIAPLAEVPPARLVSWTKGDARAERLSFGDARPAAAAAPDGGWKGASVEVLDAGASVDCDGAPDRWFRVKNGALEGWLPGCVLGAAKGGKTWALVERHARLPTYGGAPAAPAAEAARGFVDEAALVEDASVLGVRAVDDRTLEVELEQSTPYFTDLTCYTTLFPVREDLVEAFEKRGESELWFRPENLIANGAYVLDKWRFQYEITMKANPFYWNRDKLKIQRIVWLEVPEYTSNVNLYRAGDVDYLGDNLSPPPEYVPLIEKKRDFLRNDYLAVYWFELNTKKPPLNDARVRRALNLAIDKRQLVDKVTRGKQTPATHFVPDFTGLGYDEEVLRDRAAGADPFVGPGHDFDPERARALLAEAGFPVVRDGDHLRADRMPPIEILYNTSEGHRQIAVAVQSMWKEHLGVTVSIRNEEWRVMLKSYRDGNFQVMRSGQTAEYNHPQTFLDGFRSTSPQNVTGWGDEAFDRMIRDASATPDRRESMRLYRKAEKLLIDAMPRIPVYFYARLSLVKPWVRGFHGSRRNPHLVQFLWIDPAWEGGARDETAYPPPEAPPPGRFAP